MALFGRRPDSRSASGASGVASTDAGGIVLWSRDAFKALTMDHWDEELCEDADIARHVVAGDLAPIFFGFDGGYQVDVRVGAKAVLSEREVRYTTARSRGLYVLRTTASGAWVSGLEHVCPEPSSGFAVPLRGGDWAVDMTMVAWDDEPGARDDGGRAGTNALSDFVVIVRPVRATDAFRSEIQAFPPPA